MVAPATYVTRASTWKYLDDGAPPPGGWNGRSYNDGSWQSGAAPLGYGDADGQLPTTTVGYGPDLNNKYVTTLFRRTFNVANPASVKGMTLSVQRDDGVAVYINGTGVYTNNLSDPFDYLTWASVIVSDADESTFQTVSISPSMLVSGNNVIAAEVHQANAGSSDLVFDLELAGDGFPANLAPAANAGPDQTVSSLNNPTLNGSATDDGLPLPPGLLTFSWSKISGPGTVTFGSPNALQTGVSFSGPGTYLLRLSVSDGQFSATDDVSISVTGSQPTAPVIESVSRTGPDGNVLSFKFTAAANTTYTVQYRPNSASAWSKLMDVPATASARTIEVTDPIQAVGVGYLYRIVMPALP
jgi:hypothetical protein